MINQLDYLQDRQFRYIALELCTATLQDYVEGPRATELQSLIDPLKLLKQAASGLAHLHTLNIGKRGSKAVKKSMAISVGY